MTCSERQRHPLVLLFVDLQIQLLDALDKKLRRRELSACRHEFADFARVSQPLASLKKRARLVRFLWSNDAHLSSQIAPSLMRWVPHVHRAKPEIGKRIQIYGRRHVVPLSAMVALNDGINFFGGRPGRKCICVRECSFRRHR